MQAIGVDIAYKKPVVFAVRIKGEWQLRGYEIGDRAGMVDYLSTLVMLGMTRVYIEGVYQGPNAAVSLALSATAAIVQERCEMLGMTVTSVPAKTWHMAMLSQGGWAPNVRKDIKEWSLLCAGGLGWEEKDLGEDVENNDQSDAVCIAQYGSDMLKQEGWENDE